LIGVYGLTGLTLNAQATTADIVGTVTDPTGAVIPNATVTVRSLDTGQVRTMVSSSTGEYAFIALQVGKYSVSVAAPNFETFKVPSIVVAAGDRVRIDAKMQPGAASQSITVTDLAPALQTDTSSDGDLLGAQSVQDLPLNGRNYVNLLQVAAGINAGQPNSLQGGNRNSDQRQTGSYSANGMSDNFNNNMIDGQDNNAAGYIGVRPSIEGIDQIKVLTNNYSADLGRAAGAIVNIVTKAGTNTFHGSVFEYVRNDYFDTKNWFTSPGSPTPELRWNQFGGSIGGPIFKNKTFFFGDAEELRMIQSTPSLFSVPTAYEMNQFLTSGVGDFTDACPSSLSATSCKARYYVASPNAITAAYFNMYPHSGQIAGLFANNYSGTPKKQQNATAMDARIDHHFTPNDLLFLRYAYNPTWTLNGSSFPPEKLPGVSVPFSAGLGGVNGLSGTNTNTTQNAMVDYTHIFKPTLLMQLKTGYTRMDQQSLPLGYGMNIPTAFGMNNVNLPNVPGTSGMTQFSVTGLSGLGGAGYMPMLNTYNVLQLNGAVTWIREKHTLKMGGAAIHREVNGFGGTPGAYPTGIAVFFQLPSLAAYFPHLAYGPAAMLAGQPLEIVRVNQLVKQDLINWEPSIYVQDDWHVVRNLTLNLGLRYEVFPPDSEKHNQLSNFNLTTLAIETPATTNSHLGVSTGYGDFSPRVGFALRLPHEAALHGGFGMTFYPLSEQTPIGTGNYPYTYSETATISLTTFQFPSLSSMAIPTMGSPSALASSQTAGIGSWPKNASTFYLEQFSLEAQKQFGANVATIGYAGELGRRFSWTYNADMPAPPGTANPVIPALIYASQFPNLNTITVNTNEATMNYNALKAMLQRRTTKGLTYNINYTYARGLTSTFSPNAYNGSAGIIGGFYANNPRFDYGNSDFDIRHRLAGSITYAIPFGEKFTGAKAVALKGWQANTIAYWQTGLPFTVTDGYNFYYNGNTAVETSQDLLPYEASFVGIGTPAERPNMVHGAKIAHPNVNQYFDVTAFQSHAVGIAGNEHRNQIYGPHDRRMDLSLFKTFPIYEQAVVQFRAECFNIFNIPNFATPSAGISAWPSTLSSGAVTPGVTPLYFGESNIPSTATSSNGGTFGSISSTATNEQQRTFQFALKATF
jgi:hypothetical protein